jgi:DNA-binding transcriptional ArsR family regulator
MAYTSALAALADPTRRTVFERLGSGPKPVSEIARGLSVSRPAVSQHLSVLENAGLVTSEKRGQYVHYRLVEDNLANTLNGYLQEVCPVSRPLKVESAAKAARRDED